MTRSSDDARPPPAPPVGCPAPGLLATAASLFLHFRRPTTEAALIKRGLVPTYRDRFLRRHLARTTDSLFLGRDSGGGAGAPLASWPRRSA